MMHAIEVFKAQRLGIDVSEVFRYMGVRTKDADENMRSLAEEAVRTVSACSRGAACFLRLPIIQNESGLFIGPVQMDGNSLKRHLHGCTEAYIFAATIGLDADRAITASAKLSPARAVALDAAGSAAVENFCDQLCDHLRTMSKENLRSRFSPGYGDLPLQAQSQILNLLDVRRMIGLSATAGGMLIPTKSVTAIVGIGGDENENQRSASK